MNLFNTIQKIPPVYLVIGLIFIFRFAGALYVAESYPEFFLYNDGDDYIETSVSFANGRGFEIKRNRWFEAPRTKPVQEGFRPLLLSFLGGLAIFIFRDQWIATSCLEGFLFACLSLAVFILAIRISGSRLSGWIALGMLQLHPLFNIYSCRFSTEILFSLCVILFVLTWLNTQKTYRPQLLGIAAGISALARSTAILLLPIGCLMVFFSKQYATFKRKIIHSALFVLFFLMTISPQVIYLFCNFGTVSLTPFFGGYNLWIGNNAGNLSAYQASTGKEFLSEQARVWKKSIKLSKSLKADMSPPEQDKYWKKNALQGMKSMGIWNLLTLFVYKGWHFIRPWPQWGAHSLLQFVVLTVYELTLILLSSIGIFSLYKKGRLSESVIPISAVFLCGLIAHTIVHVMMRHRVPFMDTFLIVFAGIGITSIYTFLRNKKEASFISAH